MATGMVDKIKEKLILRRFSHSFSDSIAANAVGRLLPSEAGYTIPTGYYPVGITYFSTGHQSLVLDYLNLQYNSDQSTNYFIAVKNVTSSVVSSASFTVDALFAPEWMVKQITADEPASQSGDIMNEPVFKIKHFAGEYSNLASNGGKSFTRTDLGFFVPEGYEIFSLMQISSGGMRVSISNCDPFSPNQIIKIRNTYTSAQSGTARLGVVFVNRKFMLPDPRKGLIIWYNNPSLGSGMTFDDMCRLRTPDGYGDYSYYDLYGSGSKVSVNTLFHEDVPIEFLASGSKDDESYEWPPSKVEVISGGEYVTFLDSTCYKFTISEDWTNKQIILKFTFD